jgi:hypothetical protein
MVDKPKAVEPEKAKAFLAEYRDLVHRHGLGLAGVGEGAVMDDDEVGVVPVTDPDGHVARIHAPVEIETA